MISSPQAATKKVDAALAAVYKKASGAAAAAIFSAPELRQASAVVMGCAMAVLGIATEAAQESDGDGAIPFERAVLELMGRGIDAASSTVALDFLVDRGVFSVRDAEVIIPALQAELQAALKKYANRSEGWRKRRGEKAAGEGDQIVHAPAIARGAEPAALVQPGAQAALSSVKPAKQAKAPKPVKNPNALIGKDAEAGDAVVAQMVLDSGAQFEVFQSYVNEISATFPGVDIAQQLLLAASWLRANPSKRKTARGMARFLNSWLTNALRDANTRRQAPVRNGFGQGAVAQLPVAAAAVVAGAADGLGDLGDLMGADASGAAEEAFVAPTGGDVILDDQGKGFDAPGAADVQPSLAQPTADAPVPGLTENQPSGATDDFDVDAFLADSANTGSFGDGSLPSDSVGEGSSSLDDGFDAPIFTFGGGFRLAA